MWGTEIISWNHVFGRYGKTCEWCHKREIMHVSSGDFTVKNASAIYGITECRVQQLTKIYRDTGEVQVLNPNRRPNAHLSDDPIETFLKWYTNRIHST